MALNRPYKVTDNFYLALVTASFFRIRYIVLRKIYSTRDDFECHS